MRRMSEKAGPLAGGATQNWISLGLMVVVGAIAPRTPPKRYPWSPP